MISYPFSLPVFCCPFGFFGLLCFSLAVAEDAKGGGCSGRDDCAGRGWGKCQGRGGKEADCSDEGDDILHGIVWVCLWPQQ
eukprot:scaffold42258_cov71-Cyclotella_meneghiniana.AAC.2